MKIRFKQKYKSKYYLQKSKKIFGKYFWVSEFDLKRYKIYMLIVIFVNISLPFLLVEVFNYGDYKNGFELLFNIGYIIGFFFWNIIYVMLAFKKEYICANWKYLDDEEISFFYDSEEYKYNISELIKTDKKTTFGNIKTVYYTDKNDLRREKLKKLQTTFKW